MLFTLVAISVSIVKNIELMHYFFLEPKYNSRRQHIYMFVFREWYIIGVHQLWKVLRISCSFYYLVASTACFVHIMKIQVLAEREQKIQTEVKEIRKVFYCDLCNKQYKLAMEFEAHLSSYDHNHRKVSDHVWPMNPCYPFGILICYELQLLECCLQRFKEMREMHGTSGRDDRQKREQQRQEREMAKIAQMYPILTPWLFVIFNLFFHISFFLALIFYFWVGMVYLCYFSNFLKNLSSLLSCVCVP